MGQSGQWVLGVWCSVRLSVPTTRSSSVGTRHAFLQGPASRPAHLAGGSGLSGLEGPGLWEAGTFEGLRQVWRSKHLVCQQLCCQTCASAATWLGDWVSALPWGGMCCGFVWLLWGQRELSSKDWFMCFISSKLYRNCVEWAYPPPQPALLRYSSHSMIHPLK